MSAVSRILTVEDDATVRETLALNLRAEGYEVQEVGGGDQGLSAAREWEPDLVVLDVMLPELDGLTVFRILRKESSMPIILLTARSTETDKIIGLGSGADDYNEKPFSLGEFLTRVSDFTVMMMVDDNRAGHMIEFDKTHVIFNRPKDQRTEDYVTGRFG